MPRFIRFFLIFGLLTLLFSLPVPGSAAPRNASNPSVRVLRSSAEGVSFEVVLSEDALTFESLVVEGVEYTSVAFADAALTSVPGQPELPFLSEMLGAPFGAEVHKHKAAQ